MLLVQIIVHGHHLLRGLALGPPVLVYDPDDGGMKHGHVLHLLAGKRVKSPRQLRAFVLVLQRTLGVLLCIADLLGDHLGQLFDDF